jgi:cytochrome P450
LITRPPVPEPPDQPHALRPFLRAVRTNALTMWPKAAYHDMSASLDFLGRSNILLNAPEAVHHVLVGRPENYRRSRASVRILRPVTGQGLLLSEGDAWKLQRRTVAPALAPRVMAMLARHVVIATQAAVGRLQATIRHRAAAHSIDLLATMQSLALDIAGRSMFSLEMEHHGAAMRRLLNEFAERHAQPRLLDMLLPPSIPSPGDFGRARFKRRWMGLIETILAERLRSPPPPEPRDLLDLLRAARDPDSGVAFSPAQLRDQVATLILAGHETVAVTLFWALITLAQVPREQQALAAEARSVRLGAENATTALPGLVRTRAVVNETLRLFPPAFTMVREAIGADRIGDLTLAPRTVVMIAPWVLHRHHAFWRDPDAFLPSRFMPDQPQPPRFAFLPFGAGPRVCVGAQFAMTEALLVLAAFTERFHIERVNDRPVLPTGIVTTQPDHPAHVRLTRRDD